MSKTATARTVSTNCQCGKVFQREIRRGRPQVWCDSCMTIPFSKRVTAPVVVDVKTVTDSEGVERIANQWDQHDAIRAQIEANVAEVYAGWLAVAAHMRAQGATQFDIGNAQRDALAAAYKAAGA